MDNFYNSMHRRHEVEMNMMERQHREEIEKLEKVREPRKTLNYIEINNKDKFKQPDLLQIFLAIYTAVKLQAGRWRFYIRFIIQELTNCAYPRPSSCAPRPLEQAPLAASSSSSSTRSSKSSANVWCKLSALVKGHLTRQLFYSRSSVQLMQCIRDTSRTLIALQADPLNTEEEHVLIERLYAQVGFLWALN